METLVRSHVREEAELSLEWRYWKLTLAKLKNRPQRDQTIPQGIKLPDNIKTLKYITMHSIQSETSRYAKKQKNVTHKQEKNQSIQTAYE